MLQGDYQDLGLLPMSTDAVSLTRSRPHKSAVPGAKRWDNGGLCGAVRTQETFTRAD